MKTDKQLPMKTSVADERVQKYLAKLGYGSRRQIEDWIREKRVQINGQLAQLGDKVSAQDKITLNGRPLSRAAQAHRVKLQVLVMNKPAGQLSVAQPEDDRPCVTSLLPELKRQRWLSVGRLDMNTSGILLFTTDGALAHRLTHPSFEIQHEYLVRILGKLEARKIELLKAGILIDQKLARVDLIEPHDEQGANNWYRVCLTESKSRDIRDMFAAVGIKVNRVIRTQFGPIRLNQKLKPGAYYLLSADEISQLTSITQSESTDR